MWRKTLVSKNATVREAIAVIDSGQLQIALVIDDQERLLGTVTDGDVRRAILRGTALEAPVSDIMSTSPTSARAGDSRETMLALSKGKRVHQLPLIDDAGHVVGLQTIDHILNAKEQEGIVVLMAGGPGSRLRPLTDTTAKPMLEVGRKPLLEIILESLIGHGFRRFYIAVNYKSDQVMGFVGNGQRWGVDIRYLEEPERLGTAGALGLLPERPTAPFLVMNADLLTNINFSQLVAYHAEQQCLATLCVREQSTQIPYGVVEFERNRFVSIEEKPTHKYFINTGIYVLNPEILDYVTPAAYLDMPTLIETAQRDAHNVSVFPIREFWLDIGRHEDYESASGHYEKLFE
jgi:dTDP-glucose pyrophosphorylase